MTWKDVSVADQRILFAFLASLNGMEGRFYLSDYSLDSNQGSEAGTPLVNGGSATVDASYTTAVSVVGVTAGTRDYDVNEYVKFSNHSTIYKITVSTMSGGVGNITLHRTLTTAVDVTTTVDIYHTGNSLYTDGWTASQTGVLKVGDYFNIGEEMYIVTVDANSDGSGESILTIAPTIRASFTDGTALDFTDKQVVMRLKDDEQTKMRIVEPVLASFSLDCIESFV